MLSKSIMNSAKSSPGMVIQRMGIEYHRPVWTQGRELNPWPSLSIL